MATHRVQIIPGNPPTVDKPVLHISKGNGDQVEWWSNSPNWTVTFDDKTPFGRQNYSPSDPVAHHISVNPGAEHYKYSISVDGNSADPVIIVNP